MQFTKNVHVSKSRVLSLRYITLNSLYSPQLLSALFLLICVFGGLYWKQYGFIHVVFASMINLVWCVAGIKSRHFPGTTLGGDLRDIGAFCIFLDKKNISMIGVNWL